MAYEHDRRAFLRVVAQLPVTWSRLHDDGTAGPAFTGRTVNVSAGGIKMLSAEPTVPGERLRLELRYEPPPILVFTDATVVRVDETEGDDCASALRFVDLDRYVEQRLVRWVYSEDRRAADRRASVRIPLELIVDCQPISDDGRPLGAPFRAGTLDIAADGLRLLTDHRMRRDQLLAIELELGDPPEPLAVRGRIVWSDGTPHDRETYGVHFEQIAPPTQRAIAARALAHEQRLKRGTAEPPDT